MTAIDRLHTVDEQLAELALNGLKSRDMEVRAISAHVLAKAEDAAGVGQLTEA